MSLNESIYFLAAFFLCFLLVYFLSVYFFISIQFIAFFRFNSISISLCLLFISFCALLLKATVVILWISFSAVCKKSTTTTSSTKPWTKLLLLILQVLSFRKHVQKISTNSWKNKDKACLWLYLLGSVWVQQFCQKRLRLSRSLFLFFLLYWNSNSQPNNQLNVRQLRYHSHCPYLVLNTIKVKENIFYVMARSEIYLLTGHSGHVTAPNLDNRGSTLHWYIVFLFDTVHVWPLFFLFVFSKNLFFAKSFQITIQF